MTLKRRTNHVQHCDRRFRPGGRVCRTVRGPRGVDTTVLTKGPGALDRAEKIENYYGLAQPVSGAELERRSIENAKRLGCGL